VTAEVFGTSRQPLLIVISGPAGVGKDSVIGRMKERRLQFHFVVTATTRAPRPGEMDGRDYFFISKSQFAEMMERDELLEYATVYNDYKGIPRQQVREALASGKDVIMRLDVQGAARIRVLAPEALLIFVTAPSEEALVARLKGRETESSDSLKLRIATARKELAAIADFDYVVVNQDMALESSVDTIMSIIAAEHHRVKPRVVSL
jgi:guanylate kinase